MGFLARYVMEGRMQAIMVASLLSLLSLPLPPASIVSSAVIALVTLRHGASEGAYVLMCAFIAAMTAGFILVGDYQLVLIYTLILWMPIWIVSTILRESRHFLLAIETVVMIALLGVFTAYLFQPDLAKNWEGLLNGLLEPLIVQANPEVPIDEIKRALSVFYRFIITGMVAQTYIFWVLASLFLGRWWQAALYNPGGFRKEYLRLKGQKILAISTLAIIAGGYAFSGSLEELCWNILLVLFVLYAFFGTVVLHRTFTGMKRRQILVPLLYITMVLVPHALIPVALIGLTDTWLNLPDNITNQTNA